jgi:hypothetical protein
MEEIRINTFPELIEFIYDHEPTPELLSEIVRQGFKTLWINCPSEPDEQVRILNEFWDKWQGQNEKPVFLNIDISLKNED